jgi:hypothetical protein
MGKPRTARKRTPRRALRFDALGEALGVAGRAEAQPKPRPPRRDVIAHVADLDDYVVKAVHRGIARDKDEATRKLLAGDTAARVLYSEVARDGDAAVARRQAAWPAADYGGRTIDDPELARLASPIPYYIVLQDTAVPALATAIAKETRAYQARVRALMASTNAPGTARSYAELRDLVTASPWPGAEPSTRLGRFEAWLSTIFNDLECVEAHLLALSGEPGADLGPGRHRVRDALAWCTPRTAAWLQAQNADDTLRLADLMLALEHHGHDLGRGTPAQKTRVLSRLLDRHRRTAAAWAARLDPKRRAAAR